MIGLGALRGLTSRLAAGCPCEPPETWLASYRENMTRNQTPAVSIEQVNRFWDYRLRCGLRRCRSQDILTAAVVARYLPLMESD